MPIRLYQCPICGKQMQELYWGVYPKEVPCACGNRAKTKWAAPSAIFMDFRPGFDVGLGRHFDTKRERDYYMASHNISEDKGMSGHDRRSLPQDYRHKMAYLAQKEAARRK